MKLIFLYSQLLWHHLIYFTAVTESERFHSNLGVTYFTLGDFRRAIAHLEKSEEFRHSDDRGFARYNSYYLGFSFMNLDKYTEAIRHLEDYLSLKPNDEYTKEAINWCRSELGSKEQ
jgi:tetratricopeptide (TPR) repeat protein